MLKNTYRQKSPSNSRHHKGKFAENAARAMLAKNGYKVKASDIKVFGVQVDIVTSGLEADAEVILWEVKFHQTIFSDRMPISMEQTQRLKKAALCLSDQLGCSVALRLLFSQDGKSWRFAQLGLYDLSL